MTIKAFRPILGAMGAYVAIARKYRPQKFSDVLGQPVAVRILQQAVLLNRIPGAYLFTGPRGTGKTSLARIVSKALNCDALKAAKDAETFEPCCKCLHCSSVERANGSDMNVLEIDAASHNGIDDLREVQRFSMQVPPSGKWKIAILDEAHMMSNSAQNAALKLFEEPPPSFLPILCTTSIEKILPTVRSRCSIISLKPLSDSAIRASIEKVFSDAGQKVTPSALQAICNSSHGSLRDVQQLADQLIVNANGVLIDDEFVEDQAGIPGLRIYQRIGGLLTEAWCNGPAVWFEGIEQLWSEGYDFETLFYTVLVNFMRDARVHLAFRNMTECPVPYWTGISHDKWKERLSLTEDDLDILSQSWDEQQKLFSTLHARPIVEFWFLKAFDTKRFNSRTSV